MAQLISYGGPDPYTLIGSVIQCCGMGWTIESISVTRAFTGTCKALTMHLSSIPNEHKSQERWGVVLRGIKEGWIELLSPEVSKLVSDSARESRLRELLKGAKLVGETEEV